MSEPIVIKIPAVTEWTLKELRYACKHNKVKGYTKMDRDELIVEVNEIISKFNKGKANEGI